MYFKVFAFNNWFSDFFLFIQKDLLISYIGLLSLGLSSYKSYAVNELLSFFYIVIDLIKIRQTIIFLKYQMNNKYNIFLRACPNNKFSITCDNPN